MEARPRKAKGRLIIIEGLDGSGKNTQAKLLAHYNSVTTIHFSLVYRGETDKADAYIKVQDDYLKKNPIDNTPKETEEENNG